MSITKLALIGNGFDIAHSLKTLYSDFAEHLPTELKEEWCALLGDYQFKNGYWTDFENAIDYLSYNWFHDEQGYFFEVANGNDTKQLEEEIERINEIFSKITTELYDYLSLEENKQINKLESLKKNLDEKTMAISFNYTKTPYKYLKNVYYIHGSIAEEYIVLGYKLRTEHMGIAREATEFSKYKLREILNFRRYLKQLGLSKEQINEYLVEFRPHLQTMNSGRGSYSIDYSEETDKLYFSHLAEKVGTTKEFNYFGEPYKENLPRELSSLMRKERLKQVSSVINDYGENNHFSPYPINLETDLSTIEELTVIGHSLESDKEIIEQLLKKLTNLNKINFFTYKGEPVSELEKKLSFLSELTDVPIQKIFY